jgi:hypothetical protein
MAKTDTAEGDSVIRTSFSAVSRRNTHSFLIPSSGHNDISSGNNSIHWPAGCRRSTAQIRACCKVKAFFRECDAYSCWDMCPRTVCNCDHTSNLVQRFHCIFTSCSLLHTWSLYNLLLGIYSNRPIPGVGLRPLYCWDGGSKSRWAHGCLTAVIVVCC